MKRHVRTETEVLALIHTWAEDSPQVRVAILTSSRVDPRRTVDWLSDYDVELYVTDVERFTGSDDWLRPFGRIMVRWPLEPRPTGNPDWITRLVQFSDGVRIDFQITALQEIEVANYRDGFRVLFDRHGEAAGLPDPDFMRFRNSPPTEYQFQDRVNAFFWDIPYVAKALARKELNFAKYMLDAVIRFGQIRTLIEWYVGTTRGWDVMTGIHGRWFERVLGSELWEAYERTFAGAGEEENWKAMFEMISFVRTIASAVADRLGFSYPRKVDQDVSEFVDSIHQSRYDRRPGNVNPAE